VTPDSYTQRVGGYVSEQFEPVRHASRMYSIDDAMNLDELDEWLARTDEALGATPENPRGLHLRAQDRRPGHRPHLP
jgi:DNA ligase (NAD+)